MGMERISDEDMGLVVGGLFTWNRSINIMKYEHKDGSITNYEVLNFDEAWNLSNRLHSKNVPEDEILKQLIENGYIAG